MRERTKFSREVLEQLPNLKLLVSTGKRNAPIDSQACTDLNIESRFTGYIESGAPEMTWALLMAMARNVVTENHNFKTGGWQTTVGVDLRGKTIGIIGLGRIGQKIATYAKAFDMNVLAWSQNFTAEKAAEHGAELVSKTELLERSDFVTLHLVLSERSKDTIGADELALMKLTAYLINTSRGPLVNETALIAALTQKVIAGAALDVYDSEPLPADHQLRNGQLIGYAACGLCDR
jgi:phosphoglycerate dehydrogenase-like enzyme